MRFALQVLAQLLAFTLSAPVLSAQEPTREDVQQALLRACAFFHDHCAKHGGYVWRYSNDLKLSEGEAETGPDTIWVQPPATPSVGMAYLAAFDATGDRQYVDWAREAAVALLRGQLQSGGWNYRIEFDPAERAKWGYVDNRRYRLNEQRKNKTNITTLDDDTTTSAIRMLVQIDKRLEFGDKAIHAAARSALEALIAAQHPVGGWSQNWDRHPSTNKQEPLPVLRASYPDEWSRKWLNDWPGVYYNNDNVTRNVIDTLLLAWRTYDDEQYLAAARNAGEFLLRAQMPEPQPAWAQQYDRKMQPCWDRKFEPPAISGGESQGILLALMTLYEASGEKKFLEPVPRAIAYLRKSQLPDGRMARFYELRTNRPLYFTKDYQLTYEASDLPTHYGFITSNDLNIIEATYERIVHNGGKRGDKQDRPSANKVASILQALNERGAWVDARSMRGFNKASKEGVIESATFVKNVTTLSDYLRPDQ